MWAEQGPSVLESLRAEEGRLERSVHELADVILGQWEALSRSFLSAAEHRLARIEGLRLSSTPDAAVGLVVPDDADGAAVGDERSVELFKAVGGAARFGVGEPFRADVETWLVRRREEVERLLVEPLRQPEWIFPGGPDSDGRSWRFTGTSWQGLWDAGSSPWAASGHYFPLNDGPARRHRLESGKEIWVIPPNAKDVYFFALGHEWREALSREMPLRDIDACQRQQAGSASIAAKVLQLLFGAPWPIAKGESGTPALHRDLLRWFATMDGPFRLWLAEKWPQDGPEDRVALLFGRSYESFAAFRNQRTHLAIGVSDPYALMTMYCLERIAAAHASTAGGDLALPGETAAAGSQASPYAVGDRIEIEVEGEGQDQFVHLRRRVGAVPIDAATIRGPSLVRLFLTVRAGKGASLSWKDVQRAWMTGTGWKGPVIGEATLSRYGRRVDGLLKEQGFGKYWHYGPDQVSWSGG